MKDQTTTTKRFVNTMPDDCKPLMTERALGILNDINMVINVVPTPWPSRLYSGSFAAVYDQIPFLDERTSNNGEGNYTNIKTTEFGASLDETAANVFSRLGIDINETHYWGVYLHKLDEPNEDELTKVFSNNANDYKGEGVFAGIGYREIKHVKNEDPTEWKVHAENELLTSLRGINYWLDDKMLFVKIRDADSGLLLGEYDALKTKKGGFDHRLVRAGDHYVKMRQSPDYAEKLADLSTGTHVIPDVYQHLLSDETKAMLAERGIVIKVREAASNGFIGGSSDKFFGVKENYPPANSNSLENNYDVIRDEDFGESIEDIANNLMARMDADPSQMTYFAVYMYETTESHVWNHTKIYTTDVTEIPDSGGVLVGIAIYYNHHLTPFVEGEKEYVERNRGLKRAKLASMTDEERSEYLTDWREKMLGVLNYSLVNAEIYINDKLLKINYRDAKTGDTIYGLGGNYYLKDTKNFNAQIKRAFESLDNEIALELATVDAEYRTPTIA